MELAPYDTLEGVVVQWSPEQAAAYVSEAWQSAVSSIIETGRRLTEVKAKVGHGNWLPTVELLPFSVSTADKLMKVASHQGISNSAHGRNLPASWRTLSELSKLPEGEITQRIQSGEITPELERKTVEQWVREAKQERVTDVSAPELPTPEQNYRKVLTYRDKLADLLSEINTHLIRAEMEDEHVREGAHQILNEIYIHIESLKETERYGRFGEEGPDED